MNYSCFLTLVSPHEQNTVTHLKSRDAHKSINQFNGTWLKDDNLGVEAAILAHLINFTSFMVRCGVMESLL